MIKSNYNYSIAWYKLRFQTAVKMQLIGDLATFGRLHDISRGNLWQTVLYLVKYGKCVESKLSYRLDFYCTQCSITVVTATGFHLEKLLQLGDNSVIISLFAKFYHTNQRLEKP